MPSPVNHVDLEKDVRLAAAGTQSGSEDAATTRSSDQADMLSLNISDQEIESYCPKLRGRKLTGLLAFIAGTGFTLFGYDQGVLSALLTAEQFVETFPTTSPITGPSNHATLQSLLVAIYEIGCLVGALSNLWVGERLGRRRTIVIGGVIMIIGAILQASSFSYEQMLVGEGLLILAREGSNYTTFTSTVPAYHAECAAPEKRGYLIMIEGSLITFGIMVSFIRSYWIDFGFFFLKTSSAQWRAPIALQIVFALVMIFGIGFLPDSPRWLFEVQNDENAGMAGWSTKGAMRNHSSYFGARNPHTHPDVQRTFLAIREAALAEHTASGDSTSNKLQLGELLHGGRSQNFRRATLGVVIQAFQQITGINLITYYATLLFERLGIDDVKSRILAACNGKNRIFSSQSYCGLASGESWASEANAVWGDWTMFTMVLLAVLGSIDKSSTNIVSAVLLFVFNSFFAVGWLGMTWLYPAEITPLRIRQPANALSTASNWAFNFMVVMVTGPAFQNIGYHTYTVFACLNAFIIPIVYFFFPETAGKSLEDMDVVFAQAYNEGVSPVTVSLRKDLPPAGSAEADEILGFGLRKRRNGSHQILNTETARPAHEKQS
ncbi:Sugar (and other) transporter [Ceratobasidium sp. AG-Ba]|nr:Sugar (and other) transporter [Ceratobasidium sp. AG-Ba]